MTITGVVSFFMLENSHRSFYYTGMGGEIGKYSLTSYWAVHRCRLWLLKEGSEDMLTPKQEKFVQSLIQGMSQADAYRSAYSTKNMSDKTIYEAASRLVADSNVSARLQELRDQMTKETIMTAQDRLEWLTRLINSDKESTTDKLKAADIMNKMQGEYVQKVQAEVTNAVNISIELSDD